MGNTRTETTPTLVYIGKVSGHPSWNFPSHAHEDLSEMIFISDGEGLIKIDGQPYVVEQGDLLIYNQGIIHEECSSPICPLNTYYCGVTNLKIEGLSGNSIIPEGATPHIKTKAYGDKIKTIFSFLHEESTSKGKGYEIICESLLLTLLTWIQRMVEIDKGLPKKDPDALAVQIKAFLDQNYLKHMKLRDISEAFHMNAYYLSHVFKKKYNDSPINYMLYRRMGEAKRLLINTDMKIGEIAHFLGYENANYFTILFTKTMGESPTQCKKNGRRERVSLFEI